MNVEHIETDRLRTAVRRGGNPSQPPLLLVHGNVSSSVFFEDLIAELGDLRFCIAPDLRSYGDSERKPVDATRGLRDFSDDLAALIDALGIDGPLDILGWSMGGGVVLQYAIDHPQRVRSLVVESVMSPYGFGGTRLDGSPIWPDYAGSGGGTANPEFVERLAAGDRSGESPVSPRNVLNSFYFKPPFRVDPDAEEAYVTSMLQMEIGDTAYPGDTETSENWPGVAPGVQGINNAISPKYCDLSPFADLGPKPPVLWVRGAHDQIVSDTSFFDFGYLGQIGAVPGWPGEEVYPPQPMVAQVRQLLVEYETKGGSYREVVIDDSGHSPHIEQDERFLDEVTAFLG